MAHISQAFKRDVSFLGRLFLFSLLSNGLLLTFLFVETNLASRERQLYEQQTAELTNQARLAEEGKQTLEEQVAAKNAELEDTKTQLSSVQTQLSQQQAQLSTNSKELQALRKRPPLFVFDNSSIKDHAAEQASVKKLVNSAFDQIASFFGQPYLLHRVTISFVDTLSRGGTTAETEISNSSDGMSITIRLKSFDPNNYKDVNAVIHEVVHGFHGISVFMPVAYEEGMAVAAADLTMDKLQRSGDITTSERYLIGDENLVDEYRREVTIPGDTDAFYAGGQDVAKRYQILGQTFFDLEKSDPGFMKTLNEKAYAVTASGKELNYATLKRLIAESYTGTRRDLLTKRGVMLD